MSETATLTDMAREILALRYWERSQRMNAPDVEPALLLEIARLGDSEAQTQVVGANAATPDILHAIFEVADEAVRLAIVYRDQLAPKTIERAAADVSPDVRARVASRADLPDSVVAALSRDEDEIVRLSALKPAATPIGIILERAGLDESPAVRAAAVRATIHRPESALIAAMLLERADDSDCEVRENVARHPLTPREALERLATDPRTDVRLSLAESATTPEAVLERLTNDPHPIVRDAARIRKG